MMLGRQNNIRQRTLPGFMRLAIAITGLLVFSLGIWAAARSGGSRFFSIYAFVMKQLEPANRAVSLSASDPQAHLVRAYVLSETGVPGNAVEEYERAVRLRPRHFWLWLKLGSALDEAGEKERALAAFSEAVRLAPSYAEPRWQFGNALFRAGRAEAGFVEMRRAAASEPKFLPVMIDLAWGATQGDTATIEQLVQPQTNEARLALARHYARRGKVEEMMALISSLDNFPIEERKAMVADLIIARRFAEAHMVWSGKDDAGIAQITDGGFEARINLKEAGFGWQQLDAPEGVSVARDTSNPRSGAACLLLEFNGNARPSAPVLSQMVVVKPGTHYRLTFAARTQDVATGGPPLLFVLDAGRNDRPVLGYSKTLPQGTVGWQDYTVEFTTLAETGAVIISLQRENCQSGPCRIFGRVWLDDFGLQSLDGR